MMAPSDNTPSTGGGSLDPNLPPVSLRGRKLRHYQLEERLGAGGMGVVYKARDLHLDRVVVVKVLPSGAMADEEQRRRFSLEAKAASALNHSGIITIYDIDVDQGVDFIAMEYVRGRTLGEHLERGPLAVKEAVDLALQVARALAAAHAAGIVHRDLKPANVMVSENGSVKVLDFGLAKASTWRAGNHQTEIPTQDCKNATAEGTLLGTLGYMSPEQAEGKPVDARSDLFAFGAVLYEMLSGRRAFDGPSPVAVLSAVLTQTPPPLATLRPDVPEDLDRILRRCMEKDRGARYASSDELCRDLEECRSALQYRGFNLRALMHRPRVAVPAVLVLVGLIAGAGWFSVRILHQARARRVLIPEISRLTEKEEHFKAFLLARQAVAILGNDLLLAQTLLSSVVQVEYKLGLRPWEQGKPAKGEPQKLDGVEVFVRPINGDESSWVRIGVSGNQRVMAPRGAAVYRFQHPLADPEVYRDWMEGPKPSRHGLLLPKGQTPPGMAMAWTGNPPLVCLYYNNYEKPPAVPTGPFWIDTHEVTNHAFKAFVDDGGYRRPEFWKHPFVKDGRTFSFEEAMGLLKDGTGRPGPAGWELSGFPEGQGDFPVTGVCWYEAAAYAEFAGKRLPTVRHWDAAADTEGSGYFVHASNFTGKPAPVGSFAGSINGFGLFDMAGNTREWCSTLAGDLRATCGEAASGATYYFGWMAPRPAFDRSLENGFRCMKPILPVPETLEAPLKYLGSPVVRGAGPFPEAVWKTWQGFFNYRPAPLEATSEVVDEAHPDWRLEKVTFSAAYGGERLIAYLFLPKSTRPPFQAIVFWPGAGSLITASSENGRSLPHKKSLRHLLKDGRAVIYPVLKATFERGGTPGTNVFEAGSGDDVLVMQVKDIRRAVDYMQSRPDIAGDKIGYLGVSWGAMMGPVPLAVEPRFKVASLLGGGMYGEGDDKLASFAARVTTPVQMLNGRYDYLPVETAQVPAFKALATPAEHKRHLLFEAGHGLEGVEKEVITRNLEWFDRYLGPVR